jgi:hypothetical protein
VDAAIARLVRAVEEESGIARAIHQDPARFFTDGELVVEIASLSAIHEITREVASASNRLATLVATMICRRPSKRIRPWCASRATAPHSPCAPRRIRRPFRVRRGTATRASSRGSSTRSHRNVVNHIALVRRDDGLYLKIFEMSGHTIRLVSANPSASPQVMALDARTENIEVYGFVVDSSR